MQNSVICIRITSLHGSQPSSVVFGSKTATLGPDLQVCMGPRPHLWFWAHITSFLAQESIDYICSSPHLCVFLMQNSDFMTRLTSLYGSQTSSVVLSTHNRVLGTRINRLYWFQPSPVVLCKQNNAFRTRITSLCGSKTPPVVFACKTATSGPE